MNWIQWILFALEIAPKVLQLVKEIEEAIGAGNGAAKKSIVINSVSSTLEKTGSPKEGNAALDAIDRIIDTTVDALNIAGIFKHSQ